MSHTAEGATVIHARGLARTFDTKRGREKVAVKAVGTRTFRKDNA